MDPQDQKMFKQALRYSSIGLEMGLVYALLIYLGQRLDNHYNCTPWCTIGCFIFATICTALIIYGILISYKADDDSANK